MPVSYLYDYGTTIGTYSGPDTALAQAKTDWSTTPFDAPVYIRAVVSETHTIAGTITIGTLVPTEANRLIFDKSAGVTVVWSGDLVQADVSTVYTDFIGLEFNSDQSTAGGYPIRLLNPSSGAIQKCIFRSQNPVGSRTSGNWTFRNNLFISRPGSGAYQQGVTTYNAGATGQLNFYNNSFVLEVKSGFNTSYPGVFYSYAGTATWTIKNNAFYAVNNDASNAFPIIHNGNGTATIVSDYNAIYVNTRINWGKISSTSYASLAEWQAATDDDDNSISSDPKFTNVGDGTEDFSLQSDSPCLNTGVDLSGTFTDSYNGETRPVGAGFDIGAYEMPAVAPTGTSYVVGLATSGKIIQTNIADTPDGNFSIDEGDLTIGGDLQPAGYLASDDTPGDDDDVVIGTTTLHFKDGLYTGKTEA